MLLTKGKKLSIKEMLHERRWDTQFLLFLFFLFIKDTLFIILNLMSKNHFKPKTVKINTKIFDSLSSYVGLLLVT